MGSKIQRDRDRKKGKNNEVSAIKTEIEIDTER